jgi:ribosomal-protein-alanine acetyltransferase
VALLPARFPDPRTFHLARQAACEFDVLLFALGAPEGCEPLLEFCSRIVLAPDAAAMQELWDRLPREWCADARQVDGAEMAGYGGDLLTSAAIERPPRVWQAWRRRAVLRRFERVASLPDGVDLDAAARSVVEERVDWNRIGAIERGLLREIVDRPLVIRPARKQDVAELDRIQRLSPEAVLWEPSAYLSYDCRVAEQRGRVAGFVVCRELSADEAEILSLVVDPDLRRRGIGARLLGDALERRAGATWYLEVRESNERARNLYRKQGFLDISLRPAYYQDTGEAAVVMRLKPC